ncbi:hypothetical protein A3K73_01815 [Candidatus Pacearchaeota archaeon RBG_13_36_9]|nr:MAG: hypothetical protein A3K73_01815 [Candidatus Pacearchaeota archaeon RBG_13_36_9]
MLTGPGVITKEQFDALQYLDNNKNDNGTVLFVYEDGYTQFHPALKSLYSITQEKNMALVLQQKADIKDSFSFLRVEYGTPAVIKGMKIELVNREYYFNASFCDFDYYILDKISPFGNELIQFNKVLMDSMNQDSLGLFYQNSQTLVLKRKSDNCWREEDDNK